MQKRKDKQNCESLKIKPCSLKVIEKNKNRENRMKDFFKKHVFCKKLNRKEQYAEHIITTNIQNTIFEAATKALDFQILGEIAGVDLKEFRKYDRYNWN